MNVNHRTSPDVTVSIRCKIKNGENNDGGEKGAHFI